MLETAKFSFLLLIFVFVFVCVRNFFMLLDSKTHMRARLTYFKQGRMTQQFAHFLANYQFIYGHLFDLLESVRYKRTITGFFFVTFVLFVSGVFLGSFVVQSFKGAVVLSIVQGTIPYIVLRMKLISLQMKTRLDFLPAVEVFYQQYVLSNHKNVRSVLKDSLEGERMMYPIKSVFEQLYLNLSTNREADDCLRIFSLSLGHLWAHYFGSIVRFGLLEGVDITDNLKNLIIDMRKAQRADQIERNRLLEIRLANFSPLLFLVLFVGINFKMNFHNAYYYYLIDAAGKDMLLDALLLIVASFLMGIYLSVRRM